MFIYRKINEFLENNKNIFNSIIDYTNVSENLTNDNIKELCKNASENNFHSVCILSKFVIPVKSFIKDNTKICSLIDFPYGKSSLKNKVKEIEESIINGADEIDVVINYNLIKELEYHNDLKTEIRELTEYCHKEGKIIKIIIEIGFLNYQEIETICKMCIESSVDFIMTSTGKLSNDNTFENKVEKVKYIRSILPDEVKIKFSGGIRTNEQIKELKPIVDRIGTSIIPL